MMKRHNANWPNLSPRLSITLVFFLGLGISTAQAQRPGGGRDSVLPVIVAPAVMDDQFGDTLEALGTTQANESVLVTANVTEFVRDIRFEDGDRVKQGDLLVVLDQEEEEALLKSARALLDERMASFKRAQELVQQQAISTATLEEREALLRQTEGDIEGIEAGLRNRIIRAPFDGNLGLRHVSMGALVRPGDVITTLDDLSRIKVDFDVPSVYFAALRPGLSVLGKVDAFGDEVFTGQVATVNSRVDPVTRTVTVRAILPNDDGRLVPGLLMAVHLIQNPRPGLLIPEGAIVQRASQHFVFKIEERDGAPIAVEIPVRIGARIPGKVEILEGLRVGDRVIAHGLMQVRSGQKVDIKGEMTGAETLRSFTGDELRANGGH